MNVEFIILLTISLKCTSDIRRQFNHYKEFLAEKKALRQHEDKRDRIRMNRQMQMKPRGPKWNESNYNPKFGYEPYWMRGDWVFERRNKTGTNCGNKCFEVYEKYGPVCAISYENEFKSFDNICAVRNYDCYDRHIWRVVYRGKCRSDPESYPYPGTHMDHTRFPISRAQSIISYFSSQYPGVGDIGARRDLRDDGIGVTPMMKPNPKRFRAKANSTKFHRKIH